MFAAWAGNDAPTYADAAPGLLALARIHGAALAVLSQALQWAAAKSMPVLWLLNFKTLLPKLQKEAEWCRSVVEIKVRSPSFHTDLKNLYATVPSVPHANIGIDAISFLPATR